MQRRNHNKRRESWHPPKKASPITLAEGSAVLRLPLHVSAVISQHHINRINLEKWSCNLGSRFYAKKINSFFTLTAEVFLATWSANGTFHIKHNSAKPEVDLT